MKKTAADAAFAALVTAGPTLRKLAAENEAKDQRIVELEQRVATLEQKDEVEKLAQEVHEKNLDEGRSLEETVVHLSELAKTEDFPVYKKAVELSAQRSVLGIPGSKSLGVNKLDEAVLD